MGKGGVISQSIKPQPVADYCSFTTRQAVVIRPRRITLDEYTLATDKAKYLALILPGSTLGPLYDYQVCS
jgi:hypothetical protein